MNQLNREKCLLNHVLVRFFGFSSRFSRNGRFDIKNGSYIREYGKGKELSLETASKIKIKIKKQPFGMISSFFKF